MASLPVRPLAENFSLRADAAALEALPDAIAAVLDGDALTLVDGDEDVLTVRLISQLPPSTGESARGFLRYPMIEIGSLLGVMQVHREHDDYRGQSVPPGLYGVRYLQQSLDGAHAGMTFFRDFAALVPLDDSTIAEPISQDDGLDAALELNTHAFVWGLWPASDVSATELPALGRVDDLWVLRVDLPQSGEAPLAFGLVVVGGEAPEGY